MNKGDIMKTIARHMAELVDLAMELQAEIASLKEENPALAEDSNSLDSADNGVEIEDEFDGTYQNGYNTGYDAGFDAGYAKGVRQRDMRQSIRIHQPNSRN